MKNKKGKGVLLFAFIISIPMIFLLNRSIIEVRSKELRYHLMNTQFNQAVMNHASLVLSYENNKKLYFGQISRVKYEENSLQALKMHQPELQIYHDISITTNWIDSFTLALINSIRILMGKSIIENIEESNFHHYLYYAYYYEINHQYEEAIKYYEKAYTENKNFILRAGVLLHEGYCFAMLSRPNEAERKYNEVIQKYPETEMAITASVLKKFLHGFQNEEQTILNDLPSISKTEKLIYLFAYDKAWESLTDVEQNNLSESTIINFYKAKIYENQGNKQQAANHYLEVILESPHSSLARDANRNLFLIGKRSEDTALSDLSIELNNSLKDPRMNILLADEFFSRKNKGKKPEIKSTEINPELLSAISKKNLLLAQNQMNSQTSDPPEKIKLLITTVEGDQITGQLLSETSDAIVLDTSIGKITIYQTSILSKARVK